jgi:D-alanyl-lipoteichoic acid acyltransferase DltB (MBOAT superfamily)
MELVVGAKGLFIVAIVSIALVLVSLAALILVSGWLLLRLAIVLMMGFQLPLCFLLLEFSIVFGKVIDVFSCGV